MNAMTAPQRIRLATILAALVAAVFLFTVPVSAETPTPGVSG